MARLGDDVASGSSSFFIVLAPAPSLDGKYTVFGRVVSGMDVIEKIEAVALKGEEPVTRVEVSRVTIARSP
jgi:cyclophilin family peptidyl-prolyl cis-trans isomerase